MGVFFVHFFRLDMYFGLIQSIIIVNYLSPYTFEEAARLALLRKSGFL